MMVATTPVPPASSSDARTAEHTVVTTVLALSGLAAVLGLAVRALFDAANTLDLLALAALAVALLGFAGVVGWRRVSIRTAYRTLAVLACAYLLGDLSASLLGAVDPAGSEAALRPLPALVPFAYLFAFMGWGARRGLAVSGSLLLLIVLWSGALFVTGHAPMPGLDAALDFYLEFAVSNVLLLGLLVLFAKARGEVGEVQRALAAMGLLARTDVLTGVLNRRGFREQLEREAERSEGRACRLSFVLIDVDHFKRINDRYGHPAGDQVLAELGQLLTAMIRTSDELGRWGGEEFTILMRRAAPGEALFLADRLRRAVDEHTFSGVGALTASFGVAELGPGDSLDDLIKQADEALYRAKSSGRNRTCVSRRMMEAMAGGEAATPVRSKA